MTGRKRGQWSGDVPYRAVAEREQVLGGLPGAKCLIGVDDGVSGPGVRVDDYDRYPGRKDELCIVEEVGFEDDDDTVYGRFAEPVVGARDAAHRRVGNRNEGHRE